MTAQYDAIAKEYAEGQDKRINRNYFYDPSFLALAGNLEGKTILDLACGDGRMSRQAAISGARVIGVDASSGMINLAQEKEEANPLGIKYQLGKVGELGKIGNGEFDQVWGTFLLHYAETKDELERMCEDVADNLRPGGRFIAFNTNPHCPFSPLSNKKYGSTVFPEGSLFEGQRIAITLWDGKKQGSTFYNHHWNVSTYNRALEKAGLKNIRWNSPKVSQRGLKKFGPVFWLGAFQYPTIKIITARKA